MVFGDSSANNRLVNEANKSYSWQTASSEIQNSKKNWTQSGTVKLEKSFYKKDASASVTRSFIDLRNHNNNIEKKERSDFNFNKNSNEASSNIDKLFASPNTAAHEFQKLKSLSPSSTSSNLIDKELHYK
jgi:hypothetical protein